MTADMAETASVVLHLAAKVPPFDGCGEFFPDVSLLVNDKKVSDHHAIIPTLELEKADLSELPVGERNILLLVCRELLCAAAEPFVYETVTATFTLRAGRPSPPKGGASSPRAGVRSTTFSAPPEGTAGGRGGTRHPAGFHRGSTF